MANPAPTINQINAFNATQGTTIDFNIIGGTDLVRSNIIYIYDLDDNSLICTHLYVSTESIHELPPNTDASMIYESGKSSADFVNGAQYYAQIQTFTDIAGTEGGSGLSVAKMFWCLNDPTLTIDTIPSTISTTSYNVSATYNANTSVVSNIIQQYQFSLYSATGSLLQSSGVVVGNGEQQGTSTAYDISYNFSGLSVGSSYYVVVDVTTTQGMSVSAQSSTFTVSIDTPTLGEATVVNNACDGYISVTSNLSSEYGGSGSGDIVSFETDSENVFTKLQVTFAPTQSGSGTASPDNVRPIYGVGGVEVEVQRKNLFDPTILVATGITLNDDGSITVSNNNYIYGKKAWINDIGYTGQIAVTYIVKYSTTNYSFGANPIIRYKDGTSLNIYPTVTTEYATYTAVSANNKVVDYIDFSYGSASNSTTFFMQIELNNEATAYVPYEPPTTVSKEFDVSLTPTSTDTDPYLFKAVGDVYGDRLEEDIVGGTVCWNQLAPALTSANKWEVNTAFGSGTFNSDNSITYNIATKSGSQSFCRVARNGGIPLIKNHKVLIVVTISATQDLGNVTVNTMDTQYTTMGTAQANKKTTLSVIINSTPDTGGNSFFGVFPYYRTGVDVGQSVTLYSVKVTDLTAFFGNANIADAIYAMEQANAGSGVAFMRKYFSDVFTADYDAGTLKSVSPTAHKMVGVNQWDEEWERATYNGQGVAVPSQQYMCCKNLIPVLPNTRYHFKTPGQLFEILTYDADKNYIGRLTSSAKNSSYTMPSTAHYITFGSAVANAYPVYNKGDICINISDPTINGKYFQYEEHTYELGNVPLYGVFQLVNNKLKAYGDVRHAEGGTDRNFSVVDLGDLPWTKDSDGYFYSTISDRSNNDAMCEKYMFFGAMGWDNLKAQIQDKQFGFTTASAQKYILVHDSAYTTSTAFKTAVTGIKLQYEKATTTTEQTPPFTQIQEVSKYGTLEYVTTNGIPVGHNTTYLTRDIFGGTLDLVSGRLVVTYKMINMGSFDYTVSASHRFYTYLDENAKPTGSYNVKANLVCNAYNNITMNQLYAGVTGVATQSLNGNTLYIYEPSYSDATALKTALNGVQLCYELATPLTYQLTPQQIQTLVGTNNVWSEQGDIELSYHIPITNLLVKRQDVDDVSGNWLTLYSQPVEQASDMDFTFIDFLNQYGKTYKYALVPLLTQTQSGVEVEVEGGYTVSDEVQSIFDGVFISDSTGSQKCKANVGYGNVNMNQSVGSITPIGSQYPIIVTNSNNRYHNGSISGMIVPDDYYYNGNLSRIDMVNKRNELEQFLTNKRAKIIKDWNSNIWLVMIMDNIDCSFDNNYGMGIVTFNANWLEVGDPTNQEDLQATGLVNVGGV